MTAQRKIFRTQSDTDLRSDQSSDEFAETTSNRIARWDAQLLAIPWTWGILLLAALFLILFLWNQRPAALSTTIISGNGQVVAAIDGARIQLRKQSIDEPFDQISFPELILEAKFNYRGTHIGILTPTRAYIYRIDPEKLKATEVKLTSQVIENPVGLNWCNWDRSLCLSNQAGKIQALNSGDGSLTLEVDWGSELDYMSWSHTGGHLFATTKTPDRRVDQYLIDFDLPAVINLPTKEIPATLAAFDHESHFLAVSDDRRLTVYSLSEINLKMMEVDLDRSQKSTISSKGPKRIVHREDQFFAQIDLLEQVNQLAFDTNGETLAILYSNGVLQFHDIAASRKTSIANYRVEAVSDRGESITETLNSSPELIRDAMKSKGFSVTSLERLDPKNESGSTLISSIQDVGSIHLQPHANALVVLFEDGTTQVYDPTYGQPVADPLETAGIITAVAIPKDPQMLKDSPLLIAKMPTWMDAILPVIEPPEVLDKKGELPEPITKKNEPLKKELDNELKFEEPLDAAVPENPWLPSKSFATITDDGEIEVWQTGDLGRTFLLTYGNSIDVGFGFWKNQIGIDDEFVLASDDDQSKISINDLVIIGLELPIKEFEFPELNAERVLVLNLCDCRVVDPSKIPEGHLWQVIEPADKKEQARFNDALMNAMTSEYPALSSQELLRRVNESMQKDSNPSAQAVLRTFGSDKPAPNIYLPRPTPNLPTESNILPPPPLEN